MKKLLNIEFNISDLKKPSVIILILANLMPVYGVLFLKWEVFPIMALFWTENVIIGFFNVLKMAICSPASPEKWFAKLFMIPFFALHYGIFTLVHGIFVFVLFGGLVIDDTTLPNLSLLRQIGLNDDLMWGFLSLFLSHGVSFVINYIGEGEYKKAGLANLMMQPYGRVVILHLTIIFGGLLVAAIGSPTGGLLLLVALKIAIDILAHLKLHFAENYSVSKAGSVT